MFTATAQHPDPIKFIDLFCGIGGFRYAIESSGRRMGIKTQCVYSSDIDPFCQDAYEANFGERPSGDIEAIPSQDIPDHNVLLAGFPCQPFSIIGDLKGFEDTRGTLFFEICRILDSKRPDVFILENVKQLKGHNGGNTLRVIVQSLEELGYFTDNRVLNALDFGLPQKRERIWIVGFKKKHILQWPVGEVPMKPLNEILEKKVNKKYFASDYIREKRHRVMKPGPEPTIWHENKSGNISAYPFSCALRAGASYNYLLVDGQRRLTPREMLRLQGFPDSFSIVCNDSQTRKQAGNSLPINVAEAVLNQVFESMNWGKSEVRNTDFAIQLRLLEKEAAYDKKAKIKDRPEVSTPVST